MAELSSQQRQLLAALKDNGWRVVDRTNDLEWWADGVWTIESEWRPKGLRAFVTFMVDPMPFSWNRKQGEGVWSVKCTSQWPESCGRDDEITDVPLNHWDKRLPELIEQLSHFRDNSA